MTVHLTFDLDWAPAWATAWLGDLIGQHGLRGTFFVTLACEALSGLRRSGAAELGWHPNFLPGSSHGSTVDEVLDSMVALVPEAAGARAHTLMRGTPLLLAYRARGLSYDAADLHDGVANLAPFVSWTGLTRLPIWFEDDVHLQRGLPMRLASLDLERPGLKIANFHPVLVALNAADLEGYGRLKADLGRRGVPLTEASVEDFAPFVERQRPGARDLLRSLAAHLEEHPGLAGGFLRDLVVTDPR